MMKSFLFLALVCCIHTGYTQKPIVSIPNSMVLYENLYSPIQIIYPGIFSENIVLQHDRNCVVLYDSSLQSYKIMPIYGVDSCTVAIGVKKKKQVIWKDTISITVRKFKFGSPRLGKLEANSSVILEDILQQKELVYYSDIYLSEMDQIRITKYRMILLPKKGPMQEFTVKDSRITPEITESLNKCLPGDLIIFEGIRASGSGWVDRPLNPITYTIREYSGPGDQYSNILKYRQEGYYLMNGKQEHYIYPYSPHQHPPDFTDCQKDSLWKYFIYDKTKKDYRLTFIDSFKNGRLLYSANFNDTYGFISYMVKPLNDTSFNYTSYHANGRVYQQGVVIIEKDCKRYFKQKFHEYDSSPVYKSLLEQYLTDVHHPYFPIGGWKVYDSGGTLKAALHYTLSIDVNNLGCYDNSYYPPYCSRQYLRIVPEGECIFYKSDGMIEKTIIPDMK